MTMRQNLERFIRQQLFRQREVPLEKFVLRSAGVGSRGSEVESFPVEGVTVDNMVTLLDDITGRAQADADGMGSKSMRYVVIAIESGKKDGPRFPFRLRGEGDDGDNDGEDQPTPQGLQAQLMRHNEALCRMLVQTSAAAQSSLARRLESVEQQNERLLQQRAEYVAEREEAQSQQQDRDLQLLLANGQEQRADAQQRMIFQKLEAVFPLLMQKLTGSSVVPPGDSGIWQKLATSLTPEQLSGIAGMLTPEQQLQLFTILQSVKTN